MRWIGELLVEPRDLWIGLYWTRKRIDAWNEAWHLYFCLIPMVVLHVFQVHRNALIESAVAQSAQQDEHPELCDGCDGTGLMEGWNRRDGKSCPKCAGSGEVKAK